MISGTTPRAALLAALLMAPAICFAGPDVDQVFASLARPAPATTPFVEARFSRLLERPIVVQGQLEYLGKDQLARTVTSPFQERTEIKGETVVVAREGRKPRQFSLRRAPELRSMLGAFSAVLGGERAALERDFALASSGTAESWTFVLTPRSKGIARFVRDILIRGGTSEPRCLVVTEPDGDASVMLVGPAAATKLPDSPDRAQLDRICAGEGD